MTATKKKGRRLTDLMRRVRSEGKSLEQLQRDAAGSNPTKMGLETTWGDRDKPVDKTVSPVIRAGEDDVARFGHQRLNTKVCGACKHFDLEAGQREIESQEFLDRLVEEQEWKLKHLGMPIESMGLCGASGGEMLTGTACVACDHYTERSGKEGKFRL